VKAWRGVGGTLAGRWRDFAFIITMFWAVGLGAWKVNPEVLSIAKKTCQRGAGTFGVSWLLGAKSRKYPTGNFDKLLPSQV